MMNFVDLIYVETKDVRNRLVLYMFLSGISNAFILFIINGAAATVKYSEINTRLFLMFIVVISIYILTQQYIFKRASYIIDQIIQKIRMRLVEKIIQRAELVELDTIGNSRIFNHMTHQISEVSNSSNEITAAVQSFIMVLFSVMYLGTLSIEALIVTVVVVAMGMIVYLGMEKKIIPFINKHNESEIRLFSTLSHLLDGFKEIKLSHERGDDIRADINEISIEARDNSITTKVMYSNAYIFAQSFFYILIAIMVFILPRFFEMYTESVIQITAVILFIIGPLSSVVAGIPAYTRSNIAIKNISTLEAELDKLKQEPVTFNEKTHSKFLDFKKLHYKDLVFDYYDRHNDKVFSVGPIDLELNKGETLFLIGGNGSGKSTLLKLITGLYRPSQGDIMVDDLVVESRTLQEYRELFSVIFADFHLFEKLYGIRNWEPDIVSELIKEMQLTDKTAFENSQFTRINLSTGQRKRIAMIVAKLENRQIYVFDEWAADQDPQFREFYYYELLPELKKAGKTVIVVSHDESKYFATADRILKMDMGKLADLRKNTV